MNAGHDPEAPGNSTEEEGRYGTGLRKLPRAAIGFGVALFAAFTLSAFYFLYRSDGGALVASIPFRILSLAFCAVAIAVLTLSITLSLVAASALILCLLWSFGLLASAQIAFDAPAIVAVLAVNTANALFVAQLIYAVLADSCRDMDVDAAIGKNLERWMLPGAIAVATMLLPILVLARLEGDWVIVALVAAMGTVLASSPVIFAALPFVLDRMDLAETIVARANRWREWRERFLFPLAVIAVPRWALAICGAVAVLFAIVLADGGHAAQLSSANLVILWCDAGLALFLSLIAAAAMGILALRDWRGAIVCALVPAISASCGAWLIVELDIAPLEIASRELVLSIGFGGGIAILLLDAIDVYRRFDDDVETALTRAYFDSGPVIFFTGLALASSAALFGMQFLEAAGAGLMILVQTLAVAFVAPSFASVLDGVFGKRKSVEELYGAPKPSP